MNTLSIVAIGPIGDEEILRMAALTREFNPLNVISASAPRGGRAALVLHSAWISGLVSAGLDECFPDAECVTFEVLYHGSAVENERLTLEMHVENTATEGKACIVAFRVLGPRRRLIAEGRAAARLHVSP